jgi:hypothetical protein
MTSSEGIKTGTEILSKGGCMKVAQQGRINGVGGLVLMAGTLLVLLSSADASAAGSGAGGGMAITIPNALASTLLGASPYRSDVDIPKKGVCRSPFKPPEENWQKPPSWGPPPWANARVNRTQGEPPWKKSVQASLAKERAPRGKGR